MTDDAALIARLRQAAVIIGPDPDWVGFPTAAKICEEAADRIEALTGGATTDSIAGMSREDCARRIEQLTRERDDAVKRMEQGWIQVCAEPAIQHFKEAAEKAERKRDALREVLTELVACKDLKENAQAMNCKAPEVLLSEYNQRKDPAWASARAAIDAARWENP